MSETASIKCPSCGGAFKALVNKSDEYKLVCVSCGEVFSRDEVKRQLRVFALKDLKKAFSR